MLNKAVKSAKWLYSVSRGIMLIFGFFFTGTLAITVVSHSSLSWLINGKVVSLAAYTTGSTGWMVLVTFLVFFIGTVAWILIALILGVIKLIRRRHETPEDSVPQAQKGT